jgi:hypothetical protein
MRLCNTCRIEKPLSEFYFRKDSGKHRTDCKACWCIKTEKWATTNITARRAISLKWAKNNYPTIRANKARYRAADPEKMRKWCIDNPEKMRSIRHTWKMNNKPKILADVRKRQSAKLRATPSWADHDRIETIYAIAAAYVMSGIPCEVDHIVPLRSKRVCGFHCESNLQLLDPLMNRVKGNRWWPDMPCN